MMPPESDAELVAMPTPDLLELVAEVRKTALEVLDRSARRSPFGQRARIPRRHRKEIDVLHKRIRNASAELARRDEARRRLEAERQADAIRRGAVPATMAELEEVTLHHPKMTVEPQWSNVKKATDLIRTMIHDDPANVARTDNLQAYVVDLFRSLGIDVRDPIVLYVVLSSAGMVTELASNGVRHGSVAEETRVAVARIVQTLTGALLPYLPEAAR